MEEGVTPTTFCTRFMALVHAADGALVHAADGALVHAADGALVHAADGEGRAELHQCTDWTT